MCAMVKTPNGFQNASFIAVGVCQFSVSEARPGQSYRENKS